jgi:hypothetical protein
MVVANGTVTQVESFDAYRKKEQKRLDKKGAMN